MRRYSFGFESITGMVTGVVWALAKYVAPLIVLLVAGAVLLNILDRLACVGLGFTLVSATVCN